MDVKKKCEEKLNISFRDGKEFTGWVKKNSKKIARITVPKGRKYIPPGTYSFMAKQLKLSVSEFDSFLDCEFKYDKYICIIKDRLY
ncbi:MAG: hypothetical protein JXB26_01375 [Candidatus Aminicenantes bacterium]|nr:hypothetical protein [Candidatus Aminicenantes bacterium]